jgi:uncharacterized membrane protein YsdA (DUF1294 family)
MMAFWAVFALLNIITFVVMSHDKRQAVRHGRRVPERTLFLLSAIGGALGALIAMRIRRHKTKHASFVVGIPFLLILHIVLFVGYYGMNAS